MRNLLVERLYSIADFQNIKLTSSITEIPDEIAKNEKAISLLFYLQCLGTDIAYKQYMNLRTRLVDEKAKDILEYLQKERETTYSQLMAEIAEQKEK